MQANPGHFAFYSSNMLEQKSVCKTLRASTLSETLYEPGSAKATGKYKRKGGDKRKGGGVRWLDKG